MNSFISKLGGIKAILLRICFILFATFITSTAVAFSPATKTETVDVAPVEIVEPTTEEPTTEEVTEEPTTEDHTAIFSVTSLQNDIRIRVYDKNKNVITSATFEVKVISPSGEENVYTFEGKLNLKNITAGKYRVILTQPEGFEIEKLEKTITVKDTVENKVVDVDIEKDKNESNDMEEEKARILTDTVGHFESTSKVVKVWTEVAFEDVLNPYPDPNTSLLDTDDNQLYLKVTENEEDSYVAATYGDYDENTKFYKAVETETPESEETEPEEPIVTYEMVDSSKIIDPNASVLDSTELKDKDENKLYLKNGEEYEAATVAAFSEDNKFYREDEETLYTGWQVINGNRYYYLGDNTYVTGKQVIGGAEYNFSDTGKLMGKLGCDIYRGNGNNIDFKKMKSAGIEFVIIRCGYRGYETGVICEDGNFKKNLKGAIAAGLQVGIYFYSTATNEAEAVEEASTCVQLLNGTKLDFPIFFDFEGFSNTKYRTYGMTQAQRTACALAFCETIESAGYKAGIYGSKAYMTPGSGAKFDITKFEGKYCIWIAQYNDKITYTRQYDMWQNTSTGDGSYYGLQSKYIDLDYSYM